MRISGIHPASSAPCAHGRIREEDIVNDTPASHRRSSPRKCLRRLASSLFGFVLIVSMADATAVAQETFASAQAGVDALMRAVNANDEAGLHAIFGPGSEQLLSSGDKVEDAYNRSAFGKAYAQAHRLNMTDDAHATLIVGQDEWPLPIPLVKESGHWHFDTKKGEQEILARRIGRNELSAMKVCLAIVDAQHEYATRDLDADGVPEYASHFVSQPGKRDGLYWPTPANGSPSPLGALLAAAADEGYARPGARTLEPYHGYYYRILTRQGKDAPGGARDYVVRGKLIAGFALLAYPARYGASGVMTFIVGDDGAIYEQNLGPHTQDVVATIASFDPGAGWKKTGLPK